MKRRHSSALCVGLLMVTLSAQGTSKWTYLGDDQRLRYGTDANGNRIMDFSHAGYHGGSVALPMVPSARRLKAVPGDTHPRYGPQAIRFPVSRLVATGSGVQCYWRRELTTSPAR